jgi:hypothetical protein
VSTLGHASFLALLAAVATALAARPADGPVDRWEPRLERLDPARPAEYLELGEEVADAAATPAERTLARQLFGLAGALDPSRLGRHAMLALASAETTDAARDAARQKAWLLGGNRGQRSALVEDPAQIEAFSRAVSFHRRGEGAKALTALRQDGAEALLERVGPALCGGAEVFRKECKDHRSGEAFVDEVTIWSGILVELGLRSGDARSPGVDVRLLGDRALPEIDLDDPEATWGVDPARPWWRRGGWTEAQ